VLDKPFTGANVTRITSAVKENTAFRRVLLTSQQLQVTAMSVPPNESIPEEVHPYSSQLVRVVAGNGEAYIDQFGLALRPDYTFLIPAGAKHTIVNTSNSQLLQLEVVYAPPLHDANEVQLGPQQ